MHGWDLYDRPERAILILQAMPDIILGERFYGKNVFGYASFFLSRELIPGYLEGITGEYAPPEGYFVDEAACEEFDKAFPPKQKLKLPGQLF